MKALVISGGGSKGAFAGGIAEYLVEKKLNNYKLFAGSSVGSLIVSQIALGKIQKLKSVFSNISNKDIFNIFPFKVRKKYGENIISINHFNSIIAFIKGSNTFGESRNLKKLIKNMLSKGEFELIKSKTELIVTVSNVTKNIVEYIEAKDCEYEDFCDWIWASANLVPFMSLVQKNNCQYADGGFGTYLPLLRAIEKGATDIDVIILNNQEQISGEFYTNPFQSLMGVFKFMASQIEIKDLLIGKLKGKQSKIDIRMWYPPQKLTNNPLFFDKIKMKQWWELGFDTAKNTEPICYCFLPNGDVIEGDYKS